MPALIVKTHQEPEKIYQIRKSVTTVGSSPELDLNVPTSSSEKLFGIVKKGLIYEVFPHSKKISVNFRPLRQPQILQSCDRIEWDGGVAVFLLQEKSPQPLISESDEAVDWLNILQNLFQTMQLPMGAQLGLTHVLKAIVEESGAEGGHLLAELVEGQGWKAVATEGESSTSKKDLLSSTILKDALEKRDVVFVESIIGHPWSEAHSVIGARIFSVACFPLRVGERVLGAVYIYTRTPGKILKRAKLAGLSILSSQAALLLAAQEEAFFSRTALRTAGGAPSFVFNRANSQHPLHELVNRIERLAPTALTVLIRGETGTGKEWVARELHRKSGRSSGPFIPINCAAIPETLLESMLFGYEKGAFTGADSSSIGKIEQAHEGTLFLDEVGDIPLALQAKLLRVLQDKHVEPLGATVSRPIDVRIVAATHQDLENKSKQGMFRQDLFFRLRGATLEIPPLRERKEDIPVLVEYFLDRAHSKLKLTSGALAKLHQHSWPGNVRELEQAMAQAIVLAMGDSIDEEDVDLLPHLSDETTADLSLQSLRSAQDQFTRQLVAKVLDSEKGNRARAARRLGVSERTLYRLISPQ